MTKVIKGGKVDKKGRRRRRASDLEGDLSILRK